MKRLLITIFIFFILVDYSVFRKQTPEEFFSKNKEFFVINLERSLDRWNKISSYLDSIALKYKRLSATDGYTIKIKEKSSNKSFSGEDIKNNSETLQYKSHYEIFCSANEEKTFNFYQARTTSYSPGELGLWCSNYRAWKEAQSLGLDYLVLLEDDVIVKNDNFEYKINTLLKYLPSDADLLFLDNEKYAGFEMPLNPFINLYTSSAGAWGTWAVIYTKKGIDKMLSYECYSHAIDNFIWSIAGSKRYSKPPCIIERDENLIIYASSLKLIDVKKTGSEICKMGRKHWHC